MRSSLIRIGDKWMTREKISREAARIRKKYRLDETVDEPESSDLEIFVRIFLFQHKVAIAVERIELGLDSTWTSLKQSYERLCSGKPKSKH